MLTSDEATKMFMQRQKFQICVHLQKLWGQSTYSLFILFINTVNSLLNKLYTVFCSVYIEFTTSQVCMVFAVVQQQWSCMYMLCMYFCPIQPDVFAHIFPKMHANTDHTELKLECHGTYHILTSQNSILTCQYHLVTYTDNTESYTDKQYMIGTFSYLQVFACILLVILLQIHQHTNFASNCCFT